MTQSFDSSIRAKELTVIQARTADTFSAEAVRPRFDTDETNQGMKGRHKGVHDASSTDLLCRLFMPRFVRPASPGSCNCDCASAAASKHGHPLWLGSARLDRRDRQTTEPGVNSASSWTASAFPMVRQSGSDLHAGLHPPTWHVKNHKNGTCPCFTPPCFTPTKKGMKAYLTTDFADFSDKHTATHP